MPAKRDGTPIVDLAVTVASPGLIMLMVGSLVWFLVTSLAPTPYPGRLLWCLSFFVFGAVLIARLTIEEGYSYASIYAAGLGGVTLLAMIRFVEDPGPVAGLFGMALAWWLADRLTWDCTHFDEDRKTSGRGLLAAAGWDQTAPADPDDEKTDTPEEAAKPRKKDGPNLMGWMERYWRYREARRKRPHTPGTWVLYTALAAVPVFALGQSLVPAGDDSRRQMTLMEAAVFVGSALGLLVVTSLMGLRRYLQQRDARVPLPMTAGWLGLGAGLIGFFVVAAMILPRPASEIAWLGTTRVPQEGDREASRNAMLRDDDKGKGEGAEGTGSQDNADGQGSKDGDGQGQEPGGEKGNGKSGGDGKSGSGGNKQGKSGSGGQSGKSSSGGQRPGTQMIGQAIQAVGSVLKWVVWVLVALAVLAAVVYLVLKGIAPFTNWARNLLDWFRNLFNRRGAVGADGDAPAESEAGPVRPTFADFNNPFTSGAARRWPPDELAKYTLSALDAWGWDRGAGRQPGETPAEFAARLGAEFPDLEATSKRAADLAVRALYSNAPLPADAPKSLAALWKRMETAERPQLATDEHR